MQPNVVFEPFAEKNPFEEDDVVAGGVVEEEPVFFSWDALPPDLKGLILDCCVTTRDFVALSSVSKAWRYAAQTKSLLRGPHLRQLEELRQKNNNEDTFAEHNHATQKLFRRRALRFRCRARSEMVCGAVVLAVFGALLLMAGLFGAILYGAPALPLAANVTDVQNNCSGATSSSTSDLPSFCFFSCVNTTLPFAPYSSPSAYVNSLRSSLIAMSVSWLALGTSVALISLYLVYEAFCSVFYGNLLNNVVWAMIIILFLASLFLFWTIIPIWYFATRPETRMCTSTDYFESMWQYAIFSTFPIAFEALFVIFGLISMACG